MFFPGVQYSQGDVAGIVIGTLIGAAMMTAVMIFVFVRYYRGAGFIKYKDTTGITTDTPEYNNDVISTS